jgi:CNT family concentrative nucleoside transporter
VLACCFGTATSAVLPSYTRLLTPVFPNVLVHLIAASLMAVPACFLLSKILIPETERSLPAWSRRKQPIAWSDERTGSEATLYGEPPPQLLSPMEAAIVGATEGIKIAVSVVAGLIMVLGLLYFVYQFMGWLATLPNPIGSVFKLFSLPNLLGMLSLPFTVLTGVSLRWEELWQCSILIGRRFLETAIVPYQLLSASAMAGASPFSERAILLLSYTLSGFAHLSYWGIVVGASFALVPSRRRELIGLGWKALLAGTLATFMIACVAGFFDGLFGSNTLSILGKA